MRRYLFCFLLILLSVAGFGFATKPAVKAKPKPVLKTDTSVVNTRYLNKDTLKYYSKQEEFQYREFEEHTSLWTRFWRWFWHWFWGLFHFSNLFPKASFWYIVFKCLEYLVILLGLAALVFFILKLAGIDVRNVFRRKPASAGLPYAESIENIHEINFDDEIEKAISGHNYRLAVRLLYLKCLKQLSDAALIAWQPEKSNSAYVNELANTDKGATFKLLTRSFEYVWYGDFAIDAPVFKNINAMFQEFKSSIK